mmetsp:Transcript_17309/g.56621  ORF Transcript_17309/g.56621 Transcript_17309/m.56621 type:complete len:209 (-) Transcript_17309:1967-2593(-)|eukprot:scaffold7963_cov116-Isochrysis_galbana.AAC.8
MPDRACSPDLHRSARPAQLKKGRTAHASPFSSTSCVTALPPPMAQRSTKRPGTSAASPASLTSASASATSTSKRTTVDLPGRRWTRSKAASWVRGGEKPRAATEAGGSTNSIGTSSPSRVPVLEMVTASRSSGGCPGGCAAWRRTLAMGKTIGIETKPSAARTLKLVSARPSPKRKSAGPVYHLYVRPGEPEAGLGRTSMSLILTADT